MFVDSPFLLSVMISGVIAAVLTVALWLGLERSVARRMVLFAVIPSVAVAVPSSIGLPDLSRAGDGTGLLLLVFSGLCGAVIDFFSLSRKIAGGACILVILISAGLLFWGPSVLPEFDSILVRTGIISLYLVGSVCFFWLTRPDLSEDDNDAAQPEKGKKSKNTTKAKSGNTSPKADGSGDHAIHARPMPVAVLTSLAIGSGLVAWQFALARMEVFYGALSIALIVALISEKAAPQYRVSLWLGAGSGIVAGAVNVMVLSPAAIFSFAVLSLVAFSFVPAKKIAGLLPANGSTGIVVLCQTVKILVLILPVIIAVLLAYIGAKMHLAGIS